MLRSFACALSNQRVLRKRHDRLASLATSRALTDTIVANSACGIQKVDSLLYQKRVTRVTPDLHCNHPRICSLLFAQRVIRRFTGCVSTSA